MVTSQARHSHGTHRHSWELGLGAGWVGINVASVGVPSIGSGGGVDCSKHPAAAVRARSGSKPGGRR